MKRSEQESLLLILIASTASVLPTLWGTFVFDDGEAVVKNQDVVSNQGVWDTISNVFKHDFWGINLSHPHSHKSFRPLTTLSYRY